MRTKKSHPIFPNDMIEKKIKNIASGIGIIIIIPQILPVQVMELHN